MYNYKLVALLILFSFFSTHLGYVEASNSSVIVIEIGDTITAATADMVEEAVRYGEDLEAVALVIILDTPGGQLDSTFKIIDTIEGSSLPVVSFVYPKGAKAWSAGTLILISSHVAAMAPHTIIGSAQPVAYSPLGESKPIEESKVLNALSQFISERAIMHGRNETVARLFITENLNLNSEDALTLNVIDVQASDMDELLVKMDGFTVATAKGPVTLMTKGANFSEHSPSLRVNILRTISNPLLAYLLFTLGIYAFIFGLSSPGYGGEIIGIVALLTGLIGLGFDIDLGAILIIGLGAVLMIAEVYTSGFGILGGAGLFCLIIGSFLIIPFTPSRWLITPEWYSHFVSIVLAVAITLGGFTLFMVYKIIRAKRKKPFIEDVVGSEVETIEDIEDGKMGFVRFKGEYWQARADGNIKAESKALVIKKDGPRLIIKPLENEK
ncbi:NfeD family protein [[Eubacterium] cellulosolvens]